MKRWLLVVLFASSATIVRPLRIFALLGIGIALLMQRNWCALLAAISRRPLCHPANPPPRLAMRTHLVESTFLIPYLRTL
jgi:hypothetical protein